MRSNSPRTKNRQQSATLARPTARFRDADVADADGAEKKRSQLPTTQPTPWSGSANRAKPPATPAMYIPTYDPVYLIVTGVAMLVSHLVGAQMKRKFTQYSQVPLPFTGAEIAERMLRERLPEHEGRTPLGKPVYNCAQFVLRPKFGRPYALLEI